MKDIEVNGNYAAKDDEYMQVLHAIRKERKLLKKGTTLNVPARGGEKIKSNGYTKSESAAFRVRQKAKREAKKEQKITTESGEMEDWIDISDDYFEDKKIHLIDDVPMVTPTYTYNLDKVADSAKLPLHHYKRVDKSC